MDKMQNIIKREFETDSGLIVNSIIFTEDERIIVEASGDDKRHIPAQSYVMEIGSDDDCFMFVGPTNEVSFDYPADWSDAIDENNFS